MTDPRSTTSRRRRQPRAEGGSPAERSAARAAARAARAGTAPPPVAPGPPATGAQDTVTRTGTTPSAATPAPGTGRQGGQPIVSLRDVAKQYDSSKAGLGGVSLDLQRGEFTFLIGSTGAGKSTIMRILLKELEPDSGIVRVGGKDLGQITRRNVPFYRRNLGVVFQDFKLLPNRTVHDNVAYALQVTGASRKEIRTKVPDILRLTGLSTKLHNYPHQLSGGEQQRVSVARAFVNHPPLLLADEPTGNLDPETTIGIMQLLYRINKTGTTVLVATHDDETVNRMRRRVIELQQGRVVRDEVAGGYTSEIDVVAPDAAGPSALPTEPAPQPRRLARVEPGDMFDNAFQD